MSGDTVSYLPLGAPHMRDALAMLREYYAMEGLVFDEPIIISRLEYMVANPRLGRGWIVKSGDAIAGYMAVTFAFSLEHGRHAIMDEFYLHEAYRGQGLGRDVFRFVESQMLKVGVSSIHVDVERANGRAQQFWLSLGFRKYDRFPMFKLVDSSAEGADLTKGVP